VSDCNVTDRTELQQSSLEDTRVVTTALVVQATEKRTDEQQDIAFT